MFPRAAVAVLTLAAELAALPAYAGQTSGVAANAAQTSSVAASLNADLDGDGASETVTAVPSRGSVRLEVRDAAGRALADATAAAPAGSVVPVTLTSGPLGSAGALIEVVAATDAMECRTIWRYRGGQLSPMPIRGPSGQALPACAAPTGWIASWVREGDGRPAAWIREKTQKVDAGTLRMREAYGFAGFSLDFDAARSSADVAGVPIPSWYPATLYSRNALETLYSRYRLAEMRAEPTLRIEADRARGVFALRFTGPEGTLVAPVEAYAVGGGSATLGARAGERTAQVAIRLSGDGSIPYEVRVEGLGPQWDRAYSPAGAWRGAGRQVFLGAEDELASEDLVGIWADPGGRTTPIALEGEPPYRIRVGKESYSIDLGGAAPPFDALLIPLDAGGRPWGIVLKGQNSLERTAIACSGKPPRPPCRADGAPETLRRTGARINVR
ncbi:MAG: hypothetical protein ABW056_08410 [Thermoanaerobaculia bacterium]